MSACRFCRTEGGYLIKYSVRHYAHPACGLQSRGVWFFDSLTDWQCHSQFPVMVAKKFDCLNVLLARCARYEASERIAKGGAL